jgi:tetratricopeptide (TPR) repeat protein
MMWERLSVDMQQRIEAILEMPRGKEQALQAEDALREAQANGSFAEEFVARLVLTEATYYLPCEATNLVHYAWLRRALDQPLDDHDRWAVLWRLKWAVNQMRALPAIGLTAIEATIDDVEQVYQSHGYGLRPILKMRAGLAAELGDTQTEQRLTRQWMGLARDAMSDCEGCEQRDWAQVFYRADPQTALRYLAPMVSGELGCAHEPMQSLSWQALICQLTGDAEGAYHAARRGWLLAKDDPALVGALARFLLVFNRLGDVDRALTQVLAKLSWLADLDHAEDRVQWCAITAFTLELAQERGLAPAEVQGVPLTTRISELNAETAEWVAAYDNRSGSSVRQNWWADLSDKALISPGPFLLPTPVSSTLTDSTESRATDSGKPEPTSTLRQIDELAAQLRAAITTSDPQSQEIISHWLQERRHYLAEAGADLSADLAYLERVSVRQAPIADRAEMLAGALTLAQQADDRVEELRVHSERLLVCGQEHDQQTVTENLAIATELRQLTAWSDAAHVMRAMCNLVRWDEAGADVHVTWATEAADLAQRAGEPLRAGLCKIDAARWLWQAPSQAEKLLAEADLIFENHQANVWLQSALLDARGSTCAAKGDASGALSCLRAALALSGLPPFVQIPLQIQLCEMLLNLTHHDEGIVESEVLYRMCLKEGDQQALPHAQRLLGVARIESGQFLEAAELLEAAALGFSKDNPTMVDLVSWALGNAYAGMAEWGPARQSFAKAAMLFESNCRYGDAVDAQTRAGECAWEQGDLEAASAHLESALRLAEKIQDAAAFFSASRALAALSAAQGNFAGVTALDGVVAATQEKIRLWQLPQEDYDFTWAVTDLIRQGAHLLAGLGDFAAAEQRILQAETAEAVDEEFVLRCRAERGGFLVQDGRFSEADHVLRPVLQLMNTPDLLAEREHIAGMWARSLDQMGQTELAESVWAEFGPP